MNRKPTYEQLERRVRELEQAESAYKKVALAAQNTSELLSFFIKHSPIYAFIKEVSNRDSRVLYASDNYVDMIGVPGSQMIGKTMRELFPMEFAEKITRDDMDVVRRGKHLELDEELNGRNYVTYKFPLSRGGSKYLAGYTVDITDLQRAEEDLAQIFAMSLDMICIADINTATFIRVNPAFTDILGYSEEELLEKPFFDFIHPEDIDETQTVIDEKLQKSANVINFENRYRCKDGTYRWLSWVSHPNTEKGVTYAVARDITEWKQNEEALEKSKALLDTTGRMAKVGGWELDAASLEVNWTDEVYRIHGVPVGHKPSLQEAINFFHPEDRGRLREAIQRSLDCGEPYDMEIRFFTAQGEQLWTRTLCNPEIIDGKTVMLKGVFQDITERKQAVDALRENELLFRELFDNMGVGIAIYETPNDGRRFVFKELNRHGLESGQLKKGDVIGAEVRDVFPGIVTLGLFEVFQNVWKTGLPQRHPSRMYQDDRIALWVENYVFKLPSGQLVAIYEDTTAKRQAEAARDALEKQLVQAQKMESIGRLAGGVAHDFNNMLSVIIGQADMALENLDSSLPLYEKLEEIRKAGERSADLTRQLLAFARKQTISPRVIDLNETVEGMIRMLQRLIGEDIDLAWLPGRNVWPVKVDPGQIDQVLANLCVNARDAIAGVGKVTIETGNIMFDETYCADHVGFLPGEFVLLAVSDNGCGMDAETRGKIFEPFFTTKESGTGTGLGMAMVYGVVKQNNGFVNVYSEPGQGTTCKIYLPRYRAKVVAPSKKVKESRPEPGRETILLVEDEPSILKMTTAMLHRLGYQVLAATTPGEAIRIARDCDREIHLLLTDVVMPEMNGRELAKKIFSVHPNLKRLFMSGYTANVIAHHGVLDKGVNFLQKPFSRQTLGAKVREALDGAEF